MSVIDKAQAALDGTEVTFRTATLEERRAHWTAEVAKAKAYLATCPALDRWQALRMLDAAQERLAECGP